MWLATNCRSTWSAFLHCAIVYIYTPGGMGICWILIIGTLYANTVDWEDRTILFHHKFTLESWSTTLAALYYYGGLCPGHLHLKCCRFGKAILGVKWRTLSSLSCKSDRRILSCVYSSFTTVAANNDDLGQLTVCSPVAKAHATNSASQWGRLP